MGIARALLALLLLGTTGCAIPDYETVERDTGKDLLRWDHPWHGVPARCGFYVAGTGATIAFFPLSFVEAAVTNRNMHDMSGPFGVVTAHIACGCAWILGGPFYLVELVFGKPEPAPESPSRDEPSGSERPPREGGATER